MEEIKFKRIVFLNDLPRYNEGSRYKNKINWRTCIGCKVAFIYDDIEGEIKIVDYKPSTQYLYIKYMNEEVFKIKVGNFENCVLGKLLGKYTDKFKVEIGQNFIDVKHNITIIDRKKDNSYKLYKYKCNKCGFDCGEHYKNGVKYNDYWIFESNLLKGNNCICCKGLVTVKGINDIKTTAPWMVKYFYNEKEAEAYTKSSRNKIKIKCPDCRSEFVF
jgi:predicted Zn-ribbon and HTH transcriptional regulator